MARGTQAIRMLEQSGVAFTLHEYTTGGGDRSFGEAVAEELEVDPDRVFKTLVASVDGSPVVAIVPVSGHLSMKKLARAARGKHAAMTEPADAQRLTGYVVGGISPFGQRRSMPTYLDVSASGYATILVSAGRRGLQVEVAPDDLIALVDATTAEIGD
ncbi:MAG: Cys-tRNA(Pro) deacylase [Actinomycetota bacterium]